MRSRYASSGLNGFCTLQAIADTRVNQVVLQNPPSGTRGALGQRTVATQGTWRFDANLQKAMKLSESKTLEFRVDARDVLQSSGATPNLNINATTAQLCFLQVEAREIFPLKILEKTEAWTRLATDRFACVSEAS